MKKLLVFFISNLIIQSALAAEYHVAVNGNDSAAGTVSEPFKTINKAAQIAQPGDGIIVHEGTYRELIVPPRGGTCEEQRITYAAAENEHVEIKGSELISDWKKEKKNVWKVALPKSFFGDYNPYLDTINGDWFNDHGRRHHTGDVFLNGKSMYEMSSLDHVFNPIQLEKSRDPKGSVYTWYCEEEGDNIAIYANFHEYNPNKEQVEISVRKSCFYPAQPGINYITIRGFHLGQAATQWAAPTAEQRGLIGTHWSRGWIIENNVISNSRCSGITLGKDRKSGQDVWSNNRGKDGATHYNEVILRVLADGWSKEKIGSHIVRNNIIRNCEQTGICGSLGGAFSQIYNNHIYDIWTKRQFSGAEIAGIKIHASIDMIIRDNVIHNTGRGLWMDWMAQGTRLTRNICFDNTTDDLFVEVNHGPFLVDNNIFLSELALRDWSEGGAYIHNLFSGYTEVRPVPNRSTPYHHPHATALKGFKHIVGGDNRFYNNIFAGSAGLCKTSLKAGKGVKTACGLGAYNNPPVPMQVNGNVYCGSALPFEGEENSLLKKNFDMELSVEQKDDEVSLFITIPSEVISMENNIIDTEDLGQTIISEQGYDDPSGNFIKLNSDFSENARKSDPNPGPFEKIKAGKQTIVIWEK
jgi:hypothetical protein